MFSVAQKQIISAKIEEVLLSFKHPEMPVKKPSFQLHVKGKESWSWADIEPNWTYGKDNPPKKNPFNEEQVKEY